MEYKIYTDGTKSHHQTFMGWCFIVVNGQKIIRKQYGKSCTLENVTSNRAEIEALFNAILYIDSICTENDNFIIYSDNESIVNCFNGFGSRKNNRDLWETIENIAYKYIGKIKVEHVKSHYLDQFNKEADKYAKVGAYSLSIKPGEIIKEDL